MAQMVAAVSEDDKQNGLSNLDALDPRRIKAMMPDEEQAAKDAAELTDMCDDVKRRGAGETKAGLVGIRPNGMDSFNKFHDKFTSGAKEKPKPRGLIDPTKQMGDKAYTGPRFKVVAFPETFCVACGAKPIRPGEGMLNLHPVTAEWRPGGLTPGDVIRCAICKKCTKEIKDEARSELQVMHGGKMIPAKLLKQADRAKKINSIIESVLAGSTMREEGQLRDASILHL